MLDPYFPFFVLLFVAAFAVTALSERRLIPILSAKAQQPIYTEGPQWHKKKSGTPTLGGISFLLSATIIGLVCVPFFIINKDRDGLISLLLTLLYAVLNGAVGILDDFKKLERRQNEGLTPKQKLILQFSLATLYLLGRALLLTEPPVLSFSFGSISLGIFYYPLCLLVAVGSVNFANLTDGIDGLCSSVAFGIGVGLFYLSSALSPETGVLASVLIGCMLGFLCFNLYPAKIFMGDTGSLFIGALVIGSLFTLGNPLLILFFGIVYIAEGASVILQVLWYKLTRKRIFLMAPLHHHLEKKGWSENRICLTALFLTLLFSVPAYILYLP